ncbi:MAG: UDP-N-acetylglucosamine 2-epimerase (non-hydrolyzing) [Thaumarchaeota archaeon]|jgi:UDP-N-acetylglucosamine 2-epimerase (non-hydrolysing)|nr:MAG: UDP-N-acetylglucosamine 2-epimerase (non-hydrolyzing) [Nitrososphaerota archaeon]
MKTAIVLGTRPEIIKLSPLIKQLHKKNTSVIFTGQHYDYNMSMYFIHQLGLSEPNYSMKIPPTTPSLQIAEIIKKLSKILKKEKPENVIVQGDTNTVLAAAITSLKSNIPISHVESGLRSNDWRMPEEHNRIIVDNISDYLFAPTQITKQNLVSEKVHGKIFVTGNTVIDAINQFSKISKKYSKLSLDFDDYVLLTLHRSENVDNKPILSSIIKSILDSNQKFIFPIHPRTQKRLHEFNLFTKLKNSKNILTFDSVGYFEMLELMKNCQYIVTDSGGIQEEATAPMIHKKVIVVRKTTDRPEAVLNGFSELVGTSYNGILKSLRKTAKNSSVPKKKSPYGDGNSAKKIIQHLKNNL